MKQRLVRSDWALLAAGLPTAALLLMAARPVGQYPMQSLFDVYDIANAAGLAIDATGNTDSTPGMQYVAYLASKSGGRMRLPCGNFLTNLGPVIIDATGATIPAGLTGECGGSSTFNESTPYYGSTIINGNSGQTLNTPTAVTASNSGGNLLITLNAHGLLENRPVVVLAQAATSTSTATNSPGLQELNIGGTITGTFAQGQYLVDTTHPTAIPLWTTLIAEGSSTGGAGTFWTSAFMTTESADAITAYGTSNVPGNVTGMQIYWVCNHTTNAFNLCTKYTPPGSSPSTMVAWSSAGTNVVIATLPIGLMVNGGQGNINQAGLRIADVGFVGGGGTATGGDALHILNVMHVILDNIGLRDTYNGIVGDAGTWGTPEDVSDWTIRDISSRNTFNSAVNFLACADGCGNNLVQGGRIILDSAYSVGVIAGFNSAQTRLVGVHIEGNEAGLLQIAFESMGAGNVIGAGTEVEGPTVAYIPGAVLSSQASNQSYRGLKIGLMGTSTDSSSGSTVGPTNCTASSSTAALTGCGTTTGVVPGMIALATSNIPLMAFGTGQTAYGLAGGDYVQSVSGTTVNMTENSSGSGTTAVTFANPTYWWPSTLTAGWNPTVALNSYQSQHCTLSGSSVVCSDGY